MTIDLARALSALIVLGFTLSGGCGGAKPSESTVYIDVQKIPLELRDEYASFAQNCSKCHGLSRALNAPVTDPKHWDLYVARMMRTAGSAISPKEQPVILRFLHWYTLGYDKAGGMPGEASATDEYTPPAEPEAFPALSAEPGAVASPPAMQEPAQSQKPAADPVTHPASEEAQDVTQTTAGEGQ